MSYQQMPSLNAQMSDAVDGRVMPQIGQPVSDIPQNKRPIRMRSENGQNKGNQKKKGRGKGHHSPNSGQNEAAPFLEKTYDMISTGDDQIVTWSNCGNHFIIKDVDLFAKDVIPKYFDHNKFASFSRQLNFYGFKKVANKSLRKDELNPTESKWVRFQNELFKCGRKDLLPLIKRATRTPNPGNSQAQDIGNLKTQVSSLQFEVNKLKNANETLEAKLEQILSYLQKPKKVQLQPSIDAALDDNPIDNFKDIFSIKSLRQSSYSTLYNVGPPVDAAPAHTSKESGGGKNLSAINRNKATLPPHPKAAVSGAQGVPTLRPHPKQKQNKIGDVDLLNPPDPEFLRGFSSAFENNLFVTCMEGGRGSNQGSPSHSVGAAGVTVGKDQTLCSEQDGALDNILITSEKFPKMPSIRFERKPTVDEVLPPPELFD